MNMKKIEKVKNIIIYILISCVVILFDQMTKLWLYGRSLSLIGDFLWIESPALNTGAAFNMIDNNILLAVLTSFFAFVMIYLIVSNRFVKSRFVKTAISILLGGTIGNIIDRIFLGGVRDFIYFKSINFAIFNFADVFINVGVYLIVGYLIYRTFFAERHKKTDKVIQDPINIRGTDEDIEERSK